MIKVATQSTGENVNFPLNVVKKNGQPWEKVKIGPILHKDKMQMYQRSKSKNNETNASARGKMGELLYNLSIGKGFPI